MWRYEFTPSALKQISKLSKNIQKRIINKLDYFCQQNKILVFADHLIDSRMGEYRFRIGDYRVVFDIEENDLIVLAVGHRREIYKKR